MHGKAPTLYGVGASPNTLENEDQPFDLRALPQTSETSSLGGSTRCGGRVVGNVTMAAPPIVGHEVLVLILVLLPALLVHLLQVLPVGILLATRAAVANAAIV